MWIEEDHPHFLPKLKGVGSWSRTSFSSEEHEQAKIKLPEIPVTSRVKLEYGSKRENYWIGEWFMEQAKNICDMVGTFYHPHPTTHTHTRVHVFIIAKDFFKWCFEDGYSA